ncbi:unnamed protein product [Oikopleura dioica]|uniref:Uncharacterized protein n=1 Tax=Oikopleura dioica TaxID=34765 RepID=E4XRV7_OIKDI|nr:unnamed protein product [Oikopleura dioica]
MPSLEPRERGSRMNDSRQTETYKKTYDHDSNGSIFSAVSVVRPTPKRRSNRAARRSSLATATSLVNNARDEKAYGEMDDFVMPSLPTQLQQTLTDSVFNKPNNLSRRDICDISTFEMPSSFNEKFANQSAPLRTLQVTESISRERTLNEGINHMFPPPSIPREYRNLRDNFQRKEYSKFGILDSDVDNEVSSADWKLDPLVQVRWDFGDCGATGMHGPSSPQCDEYYLDTNLEMNVRINSGVQSWVVPADGLYLVTAGGPSGSSVSAGGRGRGAILEGNFHLMKGEIIDIVVGQISDYNLNSDPNSRRGLGGSGGTFVVRKQDYKILMAAGGGGGGAGRKSNVGLTKNVNDATEYPYGQNASIPLSGKGGRDYLGVGGAPGRGGSYGVDIIGYDGARKFGGGGGAGFGNLTGGSDDGSGGEHPVELGIDSRGAKNFLTRSTGLNSRGTGGILEQEEDLKSRVGASRPDLRRRLSGRKRTHYDSESYTTTDQTSNQYTTRSRTVMSASQSEAGTVISARRLSSESDSSASTVVKQPITQSMAASQALTHVTQMSKISNQGKNEADSVLGGATFKSRSKFDGVNKSTRSGIYSTIGRNAVMPEEDEEEDEDDEEKLELSDEERSAPIKSLAKSNMSLAKSQRSAASGFGSRLSRPGTTIVAAARSARSVASEAAATQSRRSAPREKSNDRSVGYSVSKELDLSMSKSQMTLTEDDPSESQLSNSESQYSRTYRSESDVSYSESYRSQSEYSDRTANSQYRV